MDDHKDGNLITLICHRNTTQTAVIAKDAKSNFERKSCHRQGMIQVFLAQTNLASKSMYSGVTQLLLRLVLHAQFNNKTKYPDSNRTSPESAMVIGSACLLIP